MLKKLLALAVVPVVLLGGYWAYRWSQESQFYGYIYKYAQRDDSGYKYATRDWLHAHHDQVRAYGQASCEWLAQQPEAPDIDPTKTTTTSGYLASDYVRIEDSTQLPVSEEARHLVVTAAWAYFCEGTRESRTSLPPGIKD